MKSRRLGFFILAAVVGALAFGAAALVARGAGPASSISVQDPVGDSGGGPDISVFTGAVNGDALTLSATLSNRTALESGESLQFFIGTPAGGILNVAVFDDGEMYLAVWTGSTYQNVHDIQGSWSGGTFTTTLSLSDMQAAIHQPVLPEVYLSVGTYTNSAVAPTLADSAPDGNESVPIATEPVATTPTTTTTTTSSPPPPAAVKPQLLMTAVRLPRSRVEWKKLVVVKVPAGSSVKISCVKGCSRTESVAVVRGIASSKRFVNVPVARGTTLLVRVVDKGGSGYWFRVDAVDKKPPGAVATSTRGCVAEGGLLVALSSC